MAIELEVKCVKSLTIAQLHQEMSYTLLQWFGDRTPHLGCTELSAQPVAAGTQVGLSVGDLAQVSLLASEIGSEAAYGEDGGLWLNVAVTEVRTPSSLFLAALCSIAAADLSRGVLIDESGLLGGSRKPDVAAVREHMARAASGASFAEAAQAVFGRLFSP